MRKHWTKSVMWGFLLTGIVVFSTGCPVVDLVTFSDKALETAIKSELGLQWGLLTKARLLEVQALDASNLEITDLKGLEYCTNLVWLNLEGNKLSNINALASLQNLTYLNLEHNQLSDLAPLAGLFYLMNLQLSGNEIWDLAPLVANAENGGMGYGSIITISEDTLLDENDQMSAAVTDQIDRLQKRGVTVVLTTATN